MDATGGNGSGDRFCSLPTWLVGTVTHGEERPAVTGRFLLVARPSIPLQATAITATTATPLRMLGRPGGVMIGQA